jgi:nucleotide-binding universal stress UspA family protein
VSTTTPPAADLHVVVGYDGSPPANRALDAAVGLLRGRTGRIEVVYVAHLSSTAMLSAGAVAEIEAGFDQIEREVRTAAQERLRDRQEGWGFQRRQGMIVDQLIAVVNDIRDADEGDIVVIVVGSSSEAMHRAVGSVAVSLARHSPVPLMIVP